MKKHFTVKYRQPGQIFWRRVKRVIGDGFESEFRFFIQEDDTIIYVSNDAEVVFPPDRQLIAERNKKDE